MINSEWSACADMLVCGVIGAAIGVGASIAQNIPKIRDSFLEEESSLVRAMLLADMMIGTSVRRALKIGFIGVMAGAMTTQSVAAMRPVAAKAASVASLH